ncbi:Type I Iterative PKS [Arthroderma sp. PD_2]|nr:Type I Iterative PKS [Arthroderma sp. PD_2]
MEKPMPIAIVGMACRTSGGVTSLDEFWIMLSRCRDGSTPIPKDRFSSEAYYHPNPQKRGTFNQLGGYFMDRDMSCFDAPFFNITRQEAVSIDPFQRQLLEISYEALERAGLPKNKISGESMGVFVGSKRSDYRYNVQDVKQIDLFSSTSNHPAVQPGRLSYYFNLNGPSCAVDTACSSGLHALHLAVNAIRNGECNSALVAAANLYLNPDDLVSMSMLGLFTPTGKTYAFDHRGTSGFACGEGSAALVIKPLDQAISDNDNIYSVIVNTGINQDGKTAGLTTPSSEMQEKLMRDVYKRANISPDDTAFVEAHGTGTKVGDPLEAAAIQRVFGNGRTKRSPLYIGSVKTNVGHLENASGLISVIKASLMLHRSFILPNTNFEKANPDIPLGEWNMKVPVNIRPWPRGKRYISINNFGFGGSNAHVVLDKAPPEVFLRAIPVEPPGNEAKPKLFAISGYDEGAARRNASQVGIYVEQHPEIFEKRIALDVAYTLGERRTHHAFRIAITANNFNELAEDLNDDALLPQRASDEPLKLAFIFTGQGAQWPQMGRELLNSHPIFAQTVKECSDFLESIGSDFSLMQELLRQKGESMVNEAHISQPICTAIQLGLVELLKSWEIKPSMVSGHSSGEMAAAYATGAITLKEAMSAAYHRGHFAAQMKQRNPDVHGAMLAVGAGPVEVKGIIKSLGLAGVTVSCENAPNSITASGDEGEIDSLALELEKRSLFNRKLRVDVAYHSGHMKLIANDYLAAIENVHSKDTNGITFYSSLLGKKLDNTEALGAQYWVDNLTKPVLFSSALEELCNDGKPDIIIEIGPHSALEGPIKQVLKGISKQAATGVKYYSALLRNQDAAVTAVKLAGNLWSNGLAINFGQVNMTLENRLKPGLISDLPSYQWSKHQYWTESRAGKSHRLKPFGRHDLLGLLQDDCNETEPAWTNVLDSDEVPWLNDHKMQSLVTFPCAGYLTMATEAASQTARMRGVPLDEIASYRMRNIQVSKAFILDDGACYDTRFTLKRYAEGLASYSNDWDEFQFSSWAPSRGWVEHCRGLVGVRKRSDANTVRMSNQKAALDRRARIQPQPGTEVDRESFYSELFGKGAGYAGDFTFKDGANLRVDGDYSAGIAVIQDVAANMPFNHETQSTLPTTFTDLIFQTCFLILGSGRGNLKSLSVPSAIGSVEITTECPNTPGETLEVVTRLQNSALKERSVFDNDAWHTNGSEPVVMMRDTVLTTIHGDAFESQEPRSVCYRVNWEPLEAQAAARPEDNAASDEAHGHTNGLTNGHINGHINGITNGHTNGHSNGGSNGYANGALTSGVDLCATPITIICDACPANPLSVALSDLIEIQTGGCRPTITSLAKAEISSSIRYIVLNEVDSPVLNNLSVDTFALVQRLLLNGLSILWVSSGAYLDAEHPHSNMAQGMLRTIRSELSKVAATLDLDTKSRLLPDDQAQLIITAMKTSLETCKDASVDYEFAEKDGKLLVPRVVEENEMNLDLFRQTQSSRPYLQDFNQPNRRIKIAVGTYGALDSVFWDDEEAYELGPDEIELKVAATGMNFKDVVIAMGQVPSPYLGIECSGTVSRIGSSVTSLKVGDRVCAMTHGAYSTFARCPATSAAMIPENIAFSTAASIPVVFCTAYYGLVELARLERGEKILIHAAPGGVGQAAIQLSQMIGAEIFATTSSSEKKNHLIDTYGIPEDHIFYSRDTSFGPALREATDGIGVDVVINSLAGDLLRETWACIAPFGRFIEIGKRDITSNTRLEMDKFEYNCSFNSVDLSKVSDWRPKIMSRVFNEVMDLISKKTIQPISPITEVGISEVEAALRKLQSGKTKGKVIVNHLVNEQVNATHRQPTGNLVKGNASYIIIGGTGGLGRSMARKLVQRGGKHIVLLSRSGKMTPELEHFSKECEADGAKIYVKPCDAADQAKVNELISELKSSLPPIRGVIHAAMVLRDTLFEKMSFEDWDEVVRSKVAGGWNFHTTLLKEPLDFFIVLSSVAGIVGNRGQAAYAAANTFLDALTVHRRKLGLKSTSLNLTAVEDAGYLAENSGKQGEVLRNLSGNRIGEAEVLALIESSINGKVGTTCDDQCVTGLEFGDTMPYFAADGKFTYLRQAALALSAAVGDDSGANIPIGNRLARMATVEEAVELVADGLRDKLGAILMLHPDVMRAKQATVTMAALGLDSLNAIELRNWIARDLQTHLQILELLRAGTLADLAGQILKKTRIEGVWTTPEEAK